MLGVRAAARFRCHAVDCRIRHDAHQPDRQPVDAERTALRRAALATAVHLSLDGEALTPARAGEVQVDESGARVATAVPLRGPESGHAQAGDQRLTMPKRLAQGHRELLVVNIGGRQAESGAASTPQSSSCSSSILAIGPGIRAAHRMVVSERWGTITSSRVYDHLLFLAGLFLAAGTARRARGAADVVHARAFRSRSRSWSSGGVHLPPLRLSNRSSRRRLRGWASRIRCANVHASRWLVVFGFGLIHGFGFAGALMDLGLGATADAMSRWRCSSSTRASNPVSSS